MKETVTDYEVAEPNEVQQEVYRSDLTGEVIEDGEMIKLVVPSEMTQVDDRISEKLKQNNPYTTSRQMDVYGNIKDIREDQKYRHTGYEKARLDVESMCENSYVVEESRDTIHLSAREYASLKGCDVDDLDANSEVPEVYAEMVNPTVENTAWIDIDSDFKDPDDAWVSIVASFFMCIVSVSYLIGFHSIIVAIIASLALGAYGVLSLFAGIYLFER